MDSREPTIMSTTSQPETQRPPATVFGLRVSSEIDLPELASVLVSSADDADVVIRRRRLPVDESTDYGLTKRADEEYLINYRAATVVIRDGCIIDVDPSQSTPDEIVRHVILGPAMHHLLHQRGRFILHASTVDFDGRAVAFLGESGQGKTTMAAACLLAGHRVMSDDVAAIEFVDRDPVVRSGYPAIKLHDSFVERFNPPVQDPVRTCDRRDRHFYGLQHDQPTEPIPLERVYFLTDGDHEAIEPVEPARRLALLAMQTYAAGLLHHPDEADTNFRWCSRLLEDVVVNRLVRRRRFDRLPDIVRLVESDLDGSS